jgi:hypothetical protein
MSIPRAIAALRAWLGDDSPADALTLQQGGMLDAKARCQEVEDRHHFAETMLHGEGILHGLVCAPVALTVTVSGGRIAAGGTYSEGTTAGTIETVVVADDATTYIWVRGAAYTTEQTSDATTLVFGTSAAAGTPPSAAHDWLLLCKAVAAAGSVTVTQYPAGCLRPDWRQSRVVRVYNGTGGALAHGLAVYVSGIQADTANNETGPSVAACDGSDPAKLPCLGLVCGEIANTSWGYVVVAGRLPLHPDVSGLGAGDQCWVDTDGTLLNAQPNHGGAFVGWTDTADVWVLGESIGHALGTAQLSWSIGDGTDVDITIYASNGDANRPGLRYDAGTSKWQYSNDGAAWNDMGTGGGAGTPCDSVTAETAYGAASAAGASAEYSRGDHTHGTPALSTANPVAIAPGSAAAPGSGSTPSKNDHVHAIACGAPSGTQHSTAAAEGSAVTAARSDHVHLTFDTTDPEHVSDTSADGTADTAARRDHIHEGLHSIAKLAGSQLTGDVTLSEGANVTLTVVGNDIAIAAAGAGSLASSVTAEATYGIAANAGAAATASKGDHTHGTPPKPPKVFTWTPFASDEDVLVGNGTIGLRVPAELNGWVITDAGAAVGTAGTTGTTDVQIRRERVGTPRASADVLSTKVTIDSAETDSSTAATARVINAANDDLATGDLLFCDVDATCTTKAKGLSVTVTAEPA